MLSEHETSNGLLKSDPEPCQRWILSNVFSKVHATNEQTLAQLVGTGRSLYMCRAGKSIVVNDLVDNLKLSI